MGKLKFTLKDESFRLHEFTALEVENVTTADAPKSFSPGRVWYLSAGVKREARPENSSLKANLVAGIGFNHPFTQEVNSYFMVRAHLQERSTDFDKIHGSAEVGILSKIGTSTKARLRLEWINKKGGGAFHSFNVSTRTQISAQHDLEFTFNNSDYLGKYFRVGLTSNF